MPPMSPSDFLAKAEAAALAGGHIWPQYAACEAALESGWGGSGLCVNANNLFGQKQPVNSLPLGIGTLVLPTQEFINGRYITVSARWVKFASWDDSFSARMALLRRLAPAFPHYAEALAAPAGAAFIQAVSLTWSTDPQRADKVLAIYAQHYPVPVVSVAPVPGV